jgi:hypothetical protein
LIGYNSRCPQSTAFSMVSHLATALGRCTPNRFHAYGVMARLARLAASTEIAELEAAAEPEAVAT